MSISTMKTNLFSLLLLLPFALIALTTKRQLTGFDILTATKLVDCSTVTCISDYIPVCGTDGLTHTNWCTATCMHKVDKANDGPCERDKVCSCAVSYKPICGADGLTYENGCFLECNNLFKVGDEKCKERYSRRCHCDKKAQEVCGRDGNTYLNKCHAVCAGTTIAYTSKCRPPQPDRSLVQPNNAANQTPNTPCNCSVELKPVCGSDNMTYANSCLAICNKITTFKHIGECQACSCPLTYEPVCAENSETYPNECAATCNKVKVVNKGPCQRSNECICAMDFAPVCGINGKSFSNRCNALCSKVEVAYEGVCKANNGCGCKFEFEPVCGKNGTTYPNKCEAGCEKVEVAYAGICNFNDNTLVNKDQARTIFDSIVRTNNCNCGDKVELVCGVDGRRYNNPCLATCNGTTVANNNACFDSRRTRTTTNPTTNTTVSTTTTNTTQLNGTPVNIDSRTEDQRKADQEKLEQQMSQMMLSNKNQGPVSATNGQISTGSTATNNAERRITSDTTTNVTTITSAIIPKDCRCEFVADTVCGSDGVTYLNSCVAGCSGITNVTRGGCPAAPVNK